MSSETVMFSAESGSATTNAVTTLATAKTTPAMMTTSPIVAALPGVRAMRNPL